MRKSEEAPRPDIIAISGRFGEFDEFKEHTAAWDIDFRQIGRGTLNATLSQLVGSSWSLAKARFDQPAFQQGAAVPGMRTFAILEHDAPENEWCGLSFSSNTMAVFAKDGAFQSVSKPGFDVYTLSFTDEQLTNACERLGIPCVMDSLSASGTVLQIDNRQARVLRKHVNNSLQALCHTEPRGAGWIAQDHIRDEISEQLVLLLENGSGTSRIPSQRVRSIALHRAFEAIEVGLEKGISVREVANASGVSRRTLEYAFRDRYNFSPKIFINSLRLARVRRDLRSRPGDVPIAEVANRWGFWHMGQFAHDYKRQFGELPSRTVKKP